MEAGWLSELLQATGLPQDMVRKELQTLFEKEGLNENNITLDQLRYILASYAQDVLAGAKEHYTE